MVTTPDASAPALTPAQRRTFDDLLSIGTDRPTTPPGLVDELTEMITEGTSTALELWTEDRLWLSKGQLTTALRCEGQLAADAAETRSFALHAATAMGTVAHRAIQIAHTHPDHPIAEYVKAAVRASRSEERFEQWWTTADLGAQSDLVTAATSKVANFLDSWPPLDAKWTPRFEDSFQARLGRLTLSARADLVLGRPKADGRQTMLLCDLKSGSLGDHHAFEAAFYALVCTLRHGCAPFRSTVYSLASGDWTDPDVDADLLRRTAATVVDGVVAMCEVLAAKREPVLRTGRHCSWCPARATCAAYAAEQATEAAGAVPATAAPAPALAAGSGADRYAAFEAPVDEPGPAATAVDAPSPVAAPAADAEDNIFELD